MKVLSNLMIALMAMSLIVACKKKPEGEAAKVGAAKQEASTPAAAKRFNVTAGTLYWTGTKVGGQHTGTININKGTIAVKDGSVASGKFNIDMSSIKNTDLPAEKQGDLVGHLSSADFFDVANHPNGNFQVVSVTAAAAGGDATHTITGNLTLKGITKSITIPANIIVNGNSLTAVTPKFTINRTDWDVKYGSGIIGTAKDKIIHDEISLNLDLKAEAS